MKKIFLSIALILYSTYHAQITLSSQPNTSDLPNYNSAFLDASSLYDTDFTGSNNIGKGLVFPQVDLKTFEFDTTTPDGAAILPTFYDGMIVYNVGTGKTIGNATKGGVQVPIKPGFYYFYNPNGRKNLNVTEGMWIPIGNSSKADYTDVAVPTGEFFDYQSSPSAAIDKREIKRIKIDLTFNGATYAEVPNIGNPAKQPFTTNTVFIRAELVNKKTGKVVLNSAEYRHQYSFDNGTTTKNYILAAYGSMYNTLKGEYIFIAEYYEKPTP